MLRYRLVKLTRRLWILLGGYKEKEEKHKLFRLFDPTESSIRIEWLGEALREHSFYYNCLSTTYRRQIYTVRKITGLDHQIHLRFYSDGWVTGHSELRPELHPLEHLDGIECQPLSEALRGQIKEIFDEGWHWHWPKE